MSLITDTLNKMKKESQEEDDSNQLMAPPALRNAVINTKKYKDFIKNSELRDVDGNKAPLKGFVLVSSVLLVSIVITAIVFFKNENESLQKKAGISSESATAVAKNQPVASKEGINTAGASNQQDNQPIQSLGRPYGSPAPEKNLEQNTASNNQNTAATAVNKQADNQMVNSGSSSNVVNMQPEPVKERPQNTQLQVSAKKQEVNNTKTVTPNNIIPANQLFIISPSSEKEISPSEKDIAAPAEEVKKNDTISGNIENNKKQDNTAQVNVQSKQMPQVNNQAENQPITENKISADNVAANNIINEVKVMKNKEQAGSVSSSTISLYNQYITTGNKAKNEGNYQRAVEYYVNALALNKNDELCANIALMYLNLKNPNMAFQVAVTNGMKNTNLLSQLAVIMAQSKYFLEANKMIQYANTFETSSSVLFATGYLYQMQNKINDAVKLYEQSVALDGNVQSAYYGALCYEQLGLKTDAKRLYSVIAGSDKASNELKNQAVIRLGKL